MGRISEVRKRDNRVVPFDQSKIADAIYRALRSEGEGDRALADELAAAVSHFLDERFAQAASTASRAVLPTIEDIQDLVETVLMEMGHPRVAKAYILYRQRRSQLRETLQVRKDRPHGEGLSYDYAAAEGLSSRRAEGALPQVEDVQYGTALWSKSKITAALIREADLDPSVAAEIASTVEQKVLASGAKRVSTSLVRELVDNELFERGFSAKLQKQQPIGLPKYNLEQIIFGTDQKEGYTFPKNPSEVREMIANRILHQYSLEEVYSPEVSEAHREGRLFIHRLSDPIRCARLIWDLPEPWGASDNRRGVESVEPPAPSEFPSVSDSDLYPGTYLDLGDFFRRLSHLRVFASEQIRLSGLSNLLLDRLSRGRDRHEVASHIVDRLSQATDNPEIVLELDIGAAGLPWLKAFLDLPPQRTSGMILSLRRNETLGGLDSKEGPDPAFGEALSLVARLYGRGGRVVFLPPSSQAARSRQPSPPRPQAAPNDAPKTALQAVLSKITLNLPRAAYRSGRDRRGSMEDELDRVLDLAIKGHLERRQFAAQLAQNQENPLWDLFGQRAGRGGPSGPLQLDLDRHVEFAVGVLGLNECVKFLTGRELHQDAAARRRGWDLVKYIDGKLRRESRRLGVPLFLEETDNLGPLHALERSDRRLYPVEDGPELSEVDRGRSRGSSYTDGVRMHRAAPVDPLQRMEELSPFIPFVAPAGGVVEEIPELRSSGGELLVSLLEESLPMDKIPRQDFSGSRSEKYLRK